MDDKLDQWIKRTRKKGPFYLVATEEKRGATYYTILWQEGMKYKIGKLHDGMRCRYGIDTLATTTSNSFTDLWQAKPGNLGYDNSLSLLAFADGGKPEHVFEIDTLKKIKW